MHNVTNGFLVCMLFLVSLSASAAPGVSVAVREALAVAARKSDREIAETSAREAAERVLERSVVRSGGKALVAEGDGGLELIEATAKYGDDVMIFAVDASPAARRVLALSAEEILPLARRLGPEAIELEARAPGVTGKVFATFGEDAGKIIAKQVPPEDIPRLLEYAEKADSPATRRLLLNCYKEEGKTLFERIPPKLVLATGLTASVLYGTHRIARAIERAIDRHPWIGAIALGIIVTIIVILLLWRFRLVPWDRKAKLDMPPPSENSQGAQDEPKHSGAKGTVE